MTTPNGRAATPVVFAGPSIPPDEVRRRLPGCTVLPPVGRGHLYQARESGAAAFLVIDGTFSHGFAVSPREVIDVVRDGALVLGASSMGAIRAAECWPVGMRGIGVVYRLYRLGVLRSDDEVAVATDSDAGHAAISCALVNVRYAARRAVLRGVVDAATEPAIVAAAQRLHFSRRTWPAILESAGVPDDHGTVAAFCARVDVKHDDAVRALDGLAAILADPAALVNRDRAPGRPPFAPPVRYPGHDRRYGHREEELRRSLTVWLFGSGRYQRYVWPLVAGEPEFGQVGTRAGDGPGELREGLVRVLSRWLATEQATQAVQTRMWHDLEYLDELDAEVSRWYAVRTLAETVTEAPGWLRRRVREEVAIAHGAATWNALLPHVVDGRLFGAIPMGWIAEACDVLARARAARLAQERPASRSLPST
jgi:hypothetical protein